jgi:hypothetical protein
LFCYCASWYESTLRTYIKYRIMSQSGGLDHVAHSLMNADETNSASSLKDDVTYSFTPYVMTRLTMGTHLSKSPHRVMIGRMKITL